MATCAFGNATLRAHTVHVIGAPRQCTVRIAHLRPHDRWTDPRLRFEPACSDNLMLARNEALQIWRPDLYFGQASLAPAG